MNIDQIIQIIVSILTGLAACIPLAIKLAQYVQKAAQEKNWGAFLGLAVDLIQEAEQKFNNGATRKEWVMAMVQASAEYINYPVDSDALSNLIDSLVGMSKNVNASGIKEPEQGDTEKQVAKDEVPCIV